MTTVGTIGRLADLYRATAASRSAIVLVLANAIPLVGVAFFGWNLWTIIVVYWLENGIVGFWNLPRILMAQGSVVGPLRNVRSFGVSETGAIGAAGRTAMAVFFTFHYGMFWFVHGVFVFLLPTFFGGVPTRVGDPSDPGILAFPPGSGPGYEAGVGVIEMGPVLVAGVALFLSHAASFGLNYLGRREYATTSPGAVVAGAYGRVVVLHLTIIFGAIAIQALGAPIAALVILVVGKTLLDLGFHLRQHRPAPQPA